MKALLVVWLMVGPVPVRALVGDSNESFGLDGSVRTITAATVNYENSILFGDHNLADGFSQTVLRITAAGAPNSWLFYELHGVQSLSLSGMSDAGVQGPGLFTFSGAGTRYQVVDTSWEWGGDSDVQSRLWLDRCNLKILLPFVDITIGRQAISFGKAYFWNPLDVFLAFDPRQFDRDYKAGVDALRVDWPLGDFSGINLVVVLGRSLNGLGGFENDRAVDSSWYGSSLLVRFFTNLAEWDLAAQAGKVYGGYQLGGAVSGELGPVALRAEAAALFASGGKVLPGTPGEQETTDHFNLVLGAGHRFDNTLHIETEYLYNGAGDPEDLEISLMRMANGGSFHLGRHILGTVISYQLLPILQSSLAWMFSISDGSSLIQPGLVLSVSDESDLLVGAMIALGARPTGSSMIDLGLQSEFGTYPNAFYMEFKLYF